MSEISNERALERTTRVAALLRQVVYCRNEADVLGLRLAHYLLDVAGAELASVQDLGLKTSDGVDLRVARGPRERDAPSSPPRDACFALPSPLEP